MTASFVRPSLGVSTGDRQPPLPSMIWQLRLVAAVCDLATPAALP